MCVTANISQYCVCFDPYIPEDLIEEWFAKETDNQVYTQPVSTNKYSIVIHHRKN